MDMKEKIVMDEKHLREWRKKQNQKEWEVENPYFEVEKELISRDRLRESTSYIINIFFIAIKNGINIRRVILECEHEIQFDRTINPKVVSLGPLKLDKSLIYLGLLAEKLHCKVQDFFSLNEEDRKTIVYDLIIANKIETCRPMQYGSEEDQLDDDIVDFYDDSLDEKILNSDYEAYKEKNKNENISLEQFKEYRYRNYEPYKFFIHKVNSNGTDEYLLEYQPSFSDIVQYDMTFEYFYNGSDLYSENEGKLAALYNEIRRVNSLSESEEELCEAIKFANIRKINVEISEGEYEKHLEYIFNRKDNKLADKKTELPRNPESNENVEEEKKVQENREETTAVNQRSDGKISKETLFKRLDRGTRSVEVMDQFEGIGDNNRFIYNELILRDVAYLCLDETRYNFISLVIQRRPGKEMIGDITFTEIKNGKFDDLKNYIIDQSKKHDFKKFVDGKETMLFDKPYHLRAQTSLNRTGYGWEWDWSGGYGDYIEGTMYGETTDYGIIGIRIEHMPY